MRSRPQKLLDGDIVIAVAEGWGFDAAEIDYVPKGGGSYHWAIADTNGEQRFVTADDLGQKPWLGQTRDRAFQGLKAAFETSRALRLDFVVAPVPTADGEILRRLSARYSIAVFPFIGGTAGRFSRYPSADERDDVVRMLIELHQATPRVESIARRAAYDLSSRVELDAALRDLDRPWDGGHFSEQARALLASHAERLASLLSTLDGLVAEVQSKLDVVITHGEPHPVNMIRSDGRLWMVDWDTAGLAPPERDLWMVADGGLDEYEQATGRKVDAVALKLYQLRWALDDVASFLAVLRSAHSFSADTEHAWVSLSGYMRALDEGRFEASSLPPLG